MCCAGAESQAYLAAHTGAQRHIPLNIDEFRPEANRISIDLHRGELRDPIRVSGRRPDGKCQKQLASPSNGPSDCMETRSEAACRLAYFCYLLHGWFAYLLAHPGVEHDSPQDIDEPPQEYSWI